MSKKMNKLKVVEKKEEIKHEPKIYLTKYLAKRIINGYKLSFLKGAFRMKEMHTVKEWDALVEKALNRKLV